MQVRSNLSRAGISILLLLLLLSSFVLIPGQRIRAQDSSTNNSNNSSPSYVLNLNKSVVNPFTPTFGSEYENETAGYKRSVDFSGAKFEYLPSDVDDRGNLRYDQWMFTETVELPKAVTPGNNITITNIGNVQLIHAGTEQTANTILTLDGGFYDEKINGLEESIEYTKLSGEPDHNPTNYGGFYLDVRYECAYQEPCKALVTGDNIIDTYKSFARDFGPSGDYLPETYPDTYNITAQYYAGGWDANVTYVYDKVATPQAPEPSGCSIAPQSYKEGQWHLWQASSGSYSAGPWQLEPKIVNGEGLVLQSIKAQDQSVLEGVSVPYFKIGYAGGAKSKVVTYCDSDKHPENWKVDRYDQIGMDVIRWNFEKEFSEEDLKGTLSISYDVVVTWDVKNDCEGLHQKCYKFIPKVSFTWSDRSGTQPTLDKFTAYYRLDYGKVGLTLTKDSDNPLGLRFKNAGQQEILKNEIRFNAVTDGKAGEYDNIHTVHQGQSVSIPGCRPTTFDCVHLHWRWTKMHRDWTNLWGGIGYGEFWYAGGRVPNADPMVEPSTGVSIPESERGTPYLVKDQTIDIAIVKYHEKGEPNEANEPNEPATDPDLVLSYADDNERIATPATNEVNTAGELTTLEDPYTLGTPEHVVVWYVASVNSKSTDTFFRHGLFVIDNPKVDTSKGPLQNSRGILGWVRDKMQSIGQLFSVEGDSSKKSEVLAHLDESLRDEYWLPDNNTLVPEKGDRVFTELSQAAILMQEMKIESPGISQTIDNATYGILFAIGNSVSSSLWNEVDKIKASSSVDDPELVDLITKNEGVNQSVQLYNAALNEIDLSKSEQIIENFRQSWKDGIGGMREVSSELAQLTSPSTPPSQPSTTPPPPSLGGGSEPTPTNASTSSKPNPPNAGRCLIATAAFGSELAPQVQFLRNFRDQHILSTAAGSSFMSVFNAWYYSFSPNVANAERENIILQESIKYAIYPLLGILTMAEKAYSIFNGEAGALAAGLVASSMIGFVYFWPMAYGITRFRKTRHLNHKVMIYIILISLASVAGGILVGDPVLLKITASAFVLVCIGVSAMVSAFLLNRIHTKKIVSYTIKLCKNYIV